MGNALDLVLLSLAHSKGALLHLPWVDVVIWLAMVELVACGDEGGGSSLESSVDVAWERGCRRLYQWLEPSGGEGVRSKAENYVGKGPVCEKFLGPACRARACRSCAISVVLVSASATLLAFSPSLCARA